MTWIAKISFLICLVTATNLAAAADSDPERFRGVDITALKSRFVKVLRTVQKPFYLYHWRSSPDLVDSVEAQQDPRSVALKILQNEAPSFISGLAAPKRTSFNMYGGGLYAAVDPVVTEGYGSLSTSRFAILAIQIPKGFRVLDLSAVRKSQASSYSVWGSVKSLVSDEESQVSAILKAFQCEPSRTNVDSILGSDLTESCADLVAHILESLKVDGFFYSYVVTKFNVCKSSEPRQSALVFTSARWLNFPGADARLYTSKTTADIEERRVIESVFAYSKTIDKVEFDPYSLDILKLSEARGVISPQRMNELRMTGWGHTSSACAAGEDCVFKLTLMSYSVGSSKPMGQLTLQRADFVPYLLPRLPDRFLIQSFYRTHWADLQGQATVPHIEEWIQENLFRCGAEDSLLQ